MGILDGGNIDPMMFWQMLNAQRNDPFSKPLAGDKFLPQGQEQQMPLNLSGTQNPPQQQQTFNNVATDFTSTEPGLPNLPDTFTGFGFGQTAPKQVQPMGLKQQLIQHMMSQLPSFQNQGNPMSHGFGNAMGFRGGMPNGLTG